MIPAPLASALTTTPNAGLPAGYRKKMPNGDERFSAAGVMFVTPDGDALFVKRAPGSDHAGEWAFPAGRVEQDEEPADAARREALEEIGHLAAWNLAPLNRETSEDGVDFATFGQPVPDAFDPILNEEHNEHLWAPLHNPPAPLHPGVAKLLQKFFAEEADEPEHGSGSAAELALELDAADILDPAERLEMGLPEKPPATNSALRMALDRASVRSYDVDGHLHIAETNVCKACVSPYKGREIPGWDEETETHALGLDPDQTYMMLRPPDVLERATPTMRGKPLLREHQPVSADDEVDETEYEVIGAVGTTPRWESPFIKNGLTIWYAKDIEGIDSRDKYELSPGYHYDPIMKPGIFEGEPYDGWMDNIRFNHVAIVEEGRQGPDVVVGDDADEILWGAIERAIERAWL